MTTTVTVRGTPSPQGSKTAFKRHGRVVMIDSCKALKEWRNRVSRACVAAGMKPEDGFFDVEIVFVYERPKSHLLVSGNPRKGSPSHPVSHDVDKLSRAVLDAMTGIAYTDDRFVQSLRASKVFGGEAGAVITVKKIQ